MSKEKHYAVTFSGQLIAIKPVVKIANHWQFYGTENENELLLRNQVAYTITVKNKK
jgi:hypothetical protein